MYVTREQAVKYVVTELGVTDEKAQKMIARIDVNNDNKINNQELTELYTKVKSA